MHITADHNAEYARVAEIGWRKEILRSPFEVGIARKSRETNLATYANDFARLIRIEAGWPM